MREIAGPRIMVKVDSGHLTRRTPGTGISICSDDDLVVVIPLVGVVTEKWIQDLKSTEMAADVFMCVSRSERSRGVA